jgi:hypothetical protein
LTVLCTECTEWKLKMHYRVHGSLQEDLFNCVKLDQKKSTYITTPVT